MLKREDVNLKKKIAVGVISLSVILIITTVIAFANYFQQTIYSINENGAICSLKTYDSSAVGKVEILKEYNGAMVTAIESNAFLKCSQVTEVIVPKTVVNVGDFSLGYIENENGEKVKKEGFVIWGRAGSEVEKYAINNGITFKVYLTTPVLKSAKNAVGGVNVTWTPVENAEGYNVYRKNAKGKWKLIAFVSGENTGKYLDTTAVNTTDCIYTVRAKTGAFLSGYDKQGVSVYYVAAPIVTLSNTQKGVQIKWTKNDKATSYRVYKKVDGATKWTRIKTVKNNVLSYIDTTSVSGEKSYYCVVAVENQNKSSYETTKFSLFLNEPTVTASKNSTKGIKIYWSKVNGAEKYRVYRRVNGSKWAKIADVSGSVFAYTDVDVLPGVKYSYTVRAISGKSISSYNKGVTTYCVNYPKLSKVEIAKNGLKVSWQKVDLANNYSVYRKNENGKWVKIHTTKNNTTLSYTDKNVVSQNNYTYTVVAWYKKVKSGFDSRGLTGTYFSSPYITSARCTDNGIVIGWESLGGAENYMIYKKEFGAPKYSRIATVTADVLSYTDTNIELGKRYIYAIKAKSVDGIISGVSNVKVKRVIDPTKPMIALTFDDGPSKNATTRILNILEANGAQATFFVVGSRVDSYKSQIKRIYDMGSEIGNHTYNHTTLTKCSATTIKNELSSTDSKVKAITGESPVLMRPPGGSYKNDTVKNNTAYPIIMWSVDTRDWESRNATSVVNHIKSHAYDGAIILMHDLYDSTATATETIVPWLISQGYQLVTVSEMMEAKGIQMQNGVAYSSAR